MRRVTTWTLAALLLAAGAQAQTVGRGGISSSGPNLTKNSDGTYSAPGQAAIKTKAGTGTGTTLSSGVLCVNTTAQATTGLVAEVIATCAIPANTLNANGMALRFTAWGTTANNGNAKSVAVRFGGLAGSLVISSSTSSAAAHWRATGEIVRTGAATQVAGGFLNLGSATAATTPNQTLANAIDLVVVGTTATAIGDLSVSGLIVELLR